MTKGSGFGAKLYHFDAVTDLTQQGFDFISLEAYAVFDGIFGKRFKHIV